MYSYYDANQPQIKYIAVSAEYKSTVRNIHSLFVAKAS